MWAQKMISLEKIAELAGVSRRTVTRALKDKSLVKTQTLAKIEAVLQENNYTPNLAARYLAVKKNHYRILFMFMRAQSSLFHAYLYEKAQKKAEELESFGITVDFLILDRDLHAESLNFDEIVRNFTYDFLIALPVYEAYFKPYFNKLVAVAAQRGVPFMFYNMDDRQYQRLCYVGCDYVKAGRIGAGLVALAVQERGRVAIISSRTSSLISYTERIVGFKQEIAERYPKLEIVYEHAMEQDVLDVDLERLRKLQVNAVYLVNPGDYSVVPLLQDNLSELNLKIITNDRLPPSEVLLKQGKIAALIEQEPDKQVTLPLDIALDFLVNRKKPQDVYYTELSVLVRQCI